MKAWENQGFDPKLVKEKGKYEWHPVLGDTYQVILHTETRDQIESLARKQVFKMMAKNKAEVPDADDNEDMSGSEDKVKSEKKSKDTQKRAKESRHNKSKDKRTRAKGTRGHKSSKSKKGKRSKGKGSSHSSDKGSSDSSSDDSDSEDTRLDHKRAKRAEELRVRKVKLDAQKVIAKVGPVLASVMPTLKHAKISLVPKPLFTRATDMCKALQTLETEAREKASDGGPSMSHTLEEVGVKCKAAQEVHSLIKSMLKSVEGF